MNDSRGGIYPYGTPDGGSPYEVSPKNVHEATPHAIKTDS